ncbi:MAG: ATP synthase subunit I [Bryobacterales bacterium]|nr:ATP synthase subunit I [Bryobacterales bacterium]
MNLERFVSNVARWKLGLAAAGALAWLLAAGRLHALAFCAGALASAASFWFLTQLVKNVGSEKANPARAALGAIRLAVIGCLLFVIMENYRLPQPPLVTGLLVALAAISIEVIREHFYA